MCAGYDRCMNGCLVYLTYAVYLIDYVVRRTYVEPTHLGPLVLSMQGARGKPERSKPPRFMETE